MGSFLQLQIEVGTKEMSELMKLFPAFEGARRDVYDYEYACQTGRLRRSSSHLS